MYLENKVRSKRLLTSDGSLGGCDFPNFSLHMNWIRPQSQEILLALFEALGLLIHDILV